MKANSESPFILEQEADTQIEEREDCDDCNRIQKHYPNGLCALHRRKRMPKIDGEKLIEDYMRIVREDILERARKGKL